MSEPSKGKRGPKRKLTDSARKRNKKVANARLNQNRVYIGDQLDRWNELRCALRLENNADVAKILLDSYDKLEQNERTQKHTEASPAVKIPSHFKFASTPGPVHSKGMGIIDISDISGSDQERLKINDVEMSGIEEITNSEVVRRTSQRTFSTKTSGMSSSFLNPFDLTITQSEVLVSDEEDSDDDYEPDLDDTLRKDHDLGLFHLSEDEESSDDEDDNYIDQPEISLGPGIHRIQSATDVDDLMSDNIYLVFSSRLMDLASASVPTVCSVKGCNEAVQVRTETVSSVIYISWVCKNDHISHKWCSQPVLNRRLHSGDLLLAASVLFSGNNFQKISIFAKFLRLPILSSSTFHRIQRTYLVPCVDRFWMKEQETVIAEFANNRVILMGDGRMDSPGHCAQYCTYTFMEFHSKKIMCIVTMDKRQTDKKSSTLEKACFVKGLQYLLSKNVDVAEIVTDAHVQIEAYMRRDHPEILHTFDIWHGAKNLGKKIIKAGQEKKNRELLEWTRDVVNHFWYCSEISTTIEEFKSIWFGITHHVIDQHEWILEYSDVGDNACKHGPLSTDREKGWLKPGSSAHIALRDIVMNKLLLKKIPYYLNCRSTSDLENFQNLILKYASKRHSYHPPAYKARSQLAALDHNAHCGRDTATNKAGEKRSHRHYSKKGARWSVYEIKTEKTYPHVTQLIRSVVQARLDDNTGMNRNVVLDIDDPRRLSRTIAPIPPPPTAQIVAEKKSRMSRVDPDATIDYEWNGDSGS